MFSGHFDILFYFKTLFIYEIYKYVYSHCGKSLMLPTETISRFLDVFQYYLQGILKSKTEIKCKITVNFIITDLTYTNIKADAQTTHIYLTHSTSYNVHCTTITFEMSRRACYLCIY